MINLNFDLKVSKNHVWNCLMNPDHFVSVHPLIYKMERLNEQQFRVSEKVNLRFFSYKFQYIATFESDSAQNNVQIRANVMGLTKIDIRIELSEIAATSTRVAESVEIKTVMPGKGFLTNLFKTQHPILFQNIEKFKIP